MQITLAKKKDFKSAKESFVFANQSTSYQSLQDYLVLEVKVGTY